MTKNSEPKPQKKRGRPTLYNQKMADLICERTATNTCGIRKLCRLYPDLPEPETINVWRYKYPIFNTQYAQAKLRQADLLAEECLEISDEAYNDTMVDENGKELCNTEFIARSRLRVDTRKWLAAKLLPKQYGKMAEEPEKEATNINITLKHEDELKKLK